MLATICLFKFANIFHLNLGNAVHGQIQKQPPKDKRKDVLRSFSKFTGKHLCQSSFLIKLDFNLQLYFTKRFWHKCFSVNFPKFLRKHFLQNNSGRQLLQIHVTLCSTYLLNDKNYNIYFLTICFYRLCLVRLIYFCRFADFKL